MNHASSSGSLAVGTGVVCALGGAACAAQLVGGSAASTLIVYDSPDGTATGKVLLSLACPISGFAAVNLDSPVVCNGQLVAVVAGTGATAVVHFLPGV